MTNVLITTDTELSAGYFKKGLSWNENYARSFAGVTDAGMTGGGDYGALWMMRVMNQHHLKGIFFIDPMPALCGGGDQVKRMVGEVLDHGHDVQLHVHTEWLQWLPERGVSLEKSSNISNFSLQEQVDILSEARALLMAAGAPQPTAFRAGNFGANDDTVRALASLGFDWDSSFNAGYMDKGCKIALSKDTIDPVPFHGLTEIPVSAVLEPKGGLRPAQVCALSFAEMKTALLGAAAQSASHFMIVSHSFEMLNRDRTKPSPILIKRFEDLCAFIGNHPQFTTDVTDVLSAPVSSTQKHYVKTNMFDYAVRNVEQLLCNMR
jgi:peptidoglycan/xylan/chitin deacetylase (PgdA/CDA1 family)